jgi:hypothetical protein
MMWACFGEPPAATAIELRATSPDDSRHGRVFVGGESDSCEVRVLEVESPAVSIAPQKLGASFVSAGGERQIIGRVANFIPLSRPGLEGARIYTALGFATFKMGGIEGAGMFECSRRSEEIAAEGEEENG